jgi:hypothetical protein
MRSNHESISRCVHAVPNKFWHMWKSTATSHHFDHPLFFPPALSLSFSHALPVSLARPHARARACSSVHQPATSTTRKNTMAFPYRDWALQQSLPPTNRGITWPNCLLKLQSRTPRVLCNISCGPYSLRSGNDYNLRFELVPSPIGSHISLKLDLYLAPRNATEEQQQLRRKYERMYATLSTYDPEGERYADRQVYQTHPRTTMSLQLARSHSLSSSRMYDTVNIAQKKWSSKSFCSPTKQLRSTCAFRGDPFNAIDSPSLARLSI